VAAENGVGANLRSVSLGHSDMGRGALSNDSGPRLAELASSKPDGLTGHKAPGLASCKSAGSAPFLWSYALRCNERAERRIAGDRQTRGLSMTAILDGLRAYSSSFIGLGALGVIACCSSSTD
jgi:hypothetical protein